MRRGDMLSWFWRGKPEDEATVAPSASTAAVGRAVNAIDYLATPAVAAYFEAREHEAYYRALKRVGPRRDFHARLIPVLERFVELTEAEPGASAVDRAMAAAHGYHGRATAGNPLASARAQHPRGVDLLGLTVPLTYESLRAAYRVAVRRNHPDVGGDHDAMVAVNEAFSLVHNLLREEQIAGGADEAGLVFGGGPEPADCPDYRYICGELLFLATLDDWNVDTSAAWLARITSAAWQHSRHAQDRQQRLALAEPAGRLASRLVGAQLVAEARRSLAVAQEALRVAQAEGLSFEHYVRESQAVIAGTKRPQVVINHPRQAEHALRLGVIDEKRYRKALEKYAAEAEEHGAVAEQLRRLQSEGGFLSNLPTDRVAQGKVARSGLIPEPDYYVTRIGQLTDDQQAEYLCAFQGSASLALVRKYTFVRLVSLLESLLYHPSEVDAAAAAREATVLGTLHDGTGAAYAADVTAAIAALASRPAEERRERAALLAAIESDQGQSSGGIRVRIVVGIGGSPLGVPLTADYMKLILRPLGDLRQLRQRGVLPENADERRKREAWSRDMDALRAPAVEASEEKAFAAMDVAKADPEGAVATWARHCELLLTLGGSMVHVEELQLGYWIDRVTATLVRLKRWDEALAWLERYYGLPDRYRGRSSASQEAGLRKRLERCRGKSA